MSEQNPYVAPQNTNYPNTVGNSMQGAKPPSIKVFGILNIVFGTLGICGLLMTGVMLFALPVDPNFPNPTFDMIQNNSAYQIFMICSVALGFIFTVVLILSGVGLLKYRKSGRTLAIWYGWYAIIAAVLGTIVNVVFVFGPMMAQANQGGAEAAGAIGGMIGGVFGGIAGLIYPIILLVFMNKQKIIDALD